MSQGKSDDGDNYPQANPGEAAGPEAPSSSSTPATAQQPNNPAPVAPENRAQQAGTEAAATPSKPPEAQSIPALSTAENATQHAEAELAAPSGTPLEAQGNPASRLPENATQQSGTEVAPDSTAGGTAQPQINPSSTETTVPESQRIPLDRIDPFPYQFRQTFDEEKLRELSESMREVGLKQPILVRPIGDRFEVVSGERRLRAAKRLDWTSISAVVQDLSNLDAAIGGLVENVQREELTPLERARAFKQLNEPPFQLSQREIARRTGLDQSGIARTMELLKQPKQIQELLSRATISPKHVRALRAVKRDSKRAELAAQAAREHWTAEETQKRVREARSEESKTHELGHDSAKGDLPAWDWLHRVLEILRMLTLLRRLGKWLLALAVRLTPGRDEPHRGGFLPARELAEPEKEEPGPESPPPSPKGTESAGRGTARRG